MRWNLVWSILPPAVMLALTIWGVRTLNRKTFVLLCVGVSSLLLGWALNVWIGCTWPSFTDSTTPPFWVFKLNTAASWLTRLGWLAFLIGYWRLMRPRSSQSAPSAGSALRRFLALLATFRASLIFFLVAVGSIALAVFFAIASIRPGGWLFTIDQRTAAKAGVCAILAVVIYLVSLITGIVVARRRPVAWWWVGFVVAAGAGVVLFLYLMD